MNGYELSRCFWDWAFENPDKMRPQHAAIYFFAIEHCNRLGWKEKFGFPSQMAMDAVGISKYQTYSKYLRDLVDLGFIKMVQQSKNQYSSNVISIISALPKNGNALDKALIKHGSKQREGRGVSEGVSDGSIDKQVNKETIKPINNNMSFEKPKDDSYKKVTEFLNLKTGKNFKHTSAKTQTLINARLKDGFTVDDFRTVILKKVYDWSNTENDIYLRPETLFGTKFEGYLNQKVSIKDKKQELKENPQDRILRELLESETEHLKIDR